MTVCWLVTLDGSLSHSSWSLVGYKLTLPSGSSGHCGTCFSTLPWRGIGFPDLPGRSLPAEDRGSTGMSSKSDMVCSEDDSAAQNRCFLLKFTTKNRWFGGFHHVMKLFMWLSHVQQRMCSSKAYGIMMWSSKGHLPCHVFWWRGPKVTRGYGLCSQCPIGKKLKPFESHTWDAFFVYLNWAYFTNLENTETAREFPWVTSCHLNFLWSLPYMKNQTLFCKDLCGRPATTTAPL